MGKKPRMRQRNLANKLLRIREALELSQSQMIRLLGFEGQIGYIRISEYEHGTHEPPLAVLLAYARVAGVCLEVLIDDEAKLPKKLPASPAHKYRR